MTYAQRVADLTRGATKREKRAIAREIEDHVTDHAEALEEQGVPPEEARARAEAAMGPAGEVAAALDAQLSPFWLWAGRLGWLVAAVATWLFYLNVEYVFRDLLILAGVVWLLPLHGWRDLWEWLSALLGGAP